ncbi:ABC transporter substrate-binding protein [Ottowia sp.]|uniref:ABC transporter substrate-binding protein n=1 Tax=Ottowia sp. TaxID=1898956 RepID=UPI002CEDD9FA|nr:ABC transporter substrate-binding protein [Ottowia sp.]HOB66599.1 ABC transporter substrate-binding protein [Ottowia sp.]HPZ58388.1 ABC transporter substrate-binding protein [Ottowia sp.]HQD48573.1 ABC transporter substrate-binding protein [Ottowia sp.]
MLTTQGLRLLATGLLMLTGPMAPAWAQPAVPGLAPIRVGIVFPLTGGSSDMGNSARVGAQVAMDEINEVGGYLGRKLELVVRDDKGNPDEALKVSKELVEQEKVTATIGFCNTGNAMKALDVFQGARHVLIVSCATGTVLTAKYPAAESYIFRNSARDQLQTQFLVNELVRRKLGKPALLVDRSGYGDTGLKDLEAALDKAGLKPHFVARFDVGAKSLDAELARARDSGADALIGWTVGPESGVIAASRARVGWKVPQFGPWGLSHRSALENSGGAVEGTMMVQTILPNRFLERHQTFFSRYGKLSKEAPIGSMMSAAQTYDAVHLLLRAMFQGKGDMSGPAIKKALENLDRPYRGVVTTYAQPFSANDHDAISANMLWLGTWQSGQRVYFYEDDAQKASVIRRKQP